MDSRDIAALDLASLESFRTELIEAGFEPIAGNPRMWAGPIFSELKDLTSAATMTIEFVDGWPFRHPRLIVQGLDEQHVGAGGEVCLWETGADTGEWLTFEGYTNRIAEWAKRVKEGFRSEDFALDSHLFFENIRGGSIATLEIKKLKLEESNEKIGIVSATWKSNDPVLDVVPGQNGEIEGRWYYVGNVETPPRNLEGVRSLLSTKQRNNFNRRFRSIEKHGESRLFLIVWDRDLGQEVLVLLAEKREGNVVAESIEVAPKDFNILKLRAGPDTEILADKSVVCFGIGALGSNLSLRLAEAGLGRLIAIDGGRLRPGDVVRHAANSLFVGSTKVSAVNLLVLIRAPWTEVVKVEKSTWNPEAIEVYIDAADLVVEATGLASFANLLSVLCETKVTPLVSSALYRKGSIVRVRRQCEGDIPIYDRSKNPRYPSIPPGEDDLVFEPGCSSPVNNASPIAVAAAAALTADIIVDVLTNRNIYAEETIDVYRSLEAEPFDKLGRLHF